MLPSCRNAKLFDDASDTREPRVYQTRLVRAALLAAGVDAKPRCSNQFRLSRSTTSQCG